MNMYLLIGTKGKIHTQMLWLWFYILEPFDHTIFCLKIYYFRRTLTIILDTNFSNNSCHIAKLFEKYFC